MHKRDLALLYVYSRRRRKEWVGKEDWQTTQLISYKIIVVLPTVAILIVFQLWNQLFMQVCFIVHLQLTESCICSISQRVLIAGVGTRDQANHTNYHKHVAGLPLDVTAELKPVFSRLSEDIPLHRCLDGKTKLKWGPQCYVLGESTEECLCCPWDLAVGHLRCSSPL